MRSTKLIRTCEKLYSNNGPSAVYEFANKSKLKYSQCVPCEAITPTIRHKNEDQCAVCGQTKQSIN